QIKIPFTFYIGPMWASSGTINFMLRQPEDVFNPIGPFTFDVAPHGAEEGFVEGCLTLDVLSISDQETATGFFRALVELRPGSEALSPIIDIQPQVFEQGLQFYYPTIPGMSVLDLYCYADGTVSTPQFDLYSCQAILVPPAGDLTT